MNKSIANIEKEVKGIYWIVPRNCWQACIKVDGKNIFLGYFKEKELAIAARLKYEKDNKIIEKRQKRLEKTEEYKKQIIEMYNSGLSTPEIAKLFNKNPTTISEMLGKLGINVTCVKQLNINLIKELYANGKTMQQIAKIIGVADITIADRLKKENIDIRPNRKFFFDENYMNVINNELKSYFLGLMFSDGCIRKDCLVAQLSLIETDSEILLPLAKFFNLKLTITKAEKIKSTNNKIYNNAAKAILTICSKQLCSDLIKHGCVPQKSLILKWPNSISEDFINHFIRGYFDGDGWISNTTFGIISSLDFCLGFQNWLQNKLQIKSYLCKAGKVYRILIHKRNDIKKLHDFLYKDATIFLKRKQIRFEELANRKLKINRQIDPFRNSSPGA